MSEWKEYKLGELAFSPKKSIISGPFGSNISSKYFVEVGVPVIRGNNLPNDMRKFHDDDFVFVTEKKADELNCYAIKDDLLFTAAGTIGQVGLLTGNEKYDKYVISNKQIRVRLDTKIVNPLFAYYWYSTNEMNSYIKNRNTGSTIPLINLSVIKDLPINIPTLSIQNKIAEILSSLDDKIELNNKINLELEQLAQTLFKQWFIDFEFPNENGEPYKSSGGEMVESELGEIPKGWEVKRLSELVKLTGGGTPKRSEHEYWDGDIMWFSVQDVPNNSEIVVINTKEKITTKGLNNSSTKLLPIGTTIITARGTVGKLAYVAAPMAMNQSCYGVNGIDSIGPFFNYLNLKKSVDELRQNTHGAVFDTITSLTFETIKTIKPDDMTLQNFEITMKPIFSIFEVNAKENIELTNLRDTLLPKLISGELAVSSL